MTSTANFKKVHFIGIGGSGLSALARLLKEQGVVVSGSDLEQSKVTDNLENLGVTVRIGEHEADNIESGVELVVYTVATPSDNPELEQAEKLGILTMTYPKFVGYLTKMKYTIAVAGTHGKTTTTAMIGVMMEKAGLDPTVIVGSDVSEFGGNARSGQSKYLVVEADEYRRAFLNYYPKIAVVLNTEFDHPDCYQDLADVQEAFTKFAGKAEQVIADVENIPNDLNLKLKLPGRHFLYDALAAQQVGRALGIDDKIIKESLEGYQGSVRRFEQKGEVNGALVIDDYAHHPTEIKATLKAARGKYSDKRLVAVFQPHHQQRTQELFDDFAEAFTDADQVIVTDIYRVAGREEEIKVTARDLAEEIGNQSKNVKYINYAKLVDYLRENVKKGDVVLIMGAGDITKVADKLVE
ncbi:MAG: UDP-N-acetylmuramate--L-alanine ligase [Parcubacteria group bacterium]|nr:UDP-N-acetylmuramate--L-alanine ligase [Parcubacteria group bacterium]